MPGLERLGSGAHRADLAAAVAVAVAHWVGLVAMGPFESMGAVAPVLVAVAAIVPGDWLLAVEHHRRTAPEGVLPIREELGPSEAAGTLGETLSLMIVHGRLD